MALRSFLLLLLPASGVALAFSLGGSGQEPPGEDFVIPPRPANATFVGSAACRDCHPQEFAGWRRTRHPRQEQPATPETVVAPFDGSEIVVEGVAMKAWREGERFFVRTLGPDGRLHDYPVLRTIGGYWKQRYVTEVDGHLAVLPLQWNVGTRRWKEYSVVGHESVGKEDYWAAPEMGWDTRCAGCHTVGAELRPREGGGWEASFAEIGIGCESCHGPGSAHVADPEAPGRIVDPSALSQQQQVDICGACHTRGLSLPEFHGVPVRTRWPQGYRPGDRLADHYRSLPREARSTKAFWADGSARSHHQQADDFQLDVHRSRAGMVCTDCHDPHDRRHPGETRLPARDNSLCLACHLERREDLEAHTHHPADSLGSLCIECHMPRVVDHAEKLQLRGHTRRPPDPAGAMVLGTPDACTRCHEDRSQTWAAQVLAGWRREPRRPWRGRAALGPVEAGLRPAHR